jgi:hypothetical protein
MPKTSQDEGLFLMQEDRPFLKGLSLQAKESKRKTERDTKA